jgi:hypothetical protein
VTTKPLLTFAALWGCLSFAAGQTPFDPAAQLSTLSPGLDSRSISFENPTGERGAGGKAASPLGPGRKGSPSRTLAPGETVTLCDIQGTGTIRHIWITVSGNPQNLRGGVIRAWWDDQAHPSIEAPIGDFMGFAHGKVMPFSTAVHSVGPQAGMNIWIPMPFAKRARITYTHEAAAKAEFFYYIDYTLGDKHPKNFGRLHVLFRRENPTTLKQDFEILPKRTGAGRYLGAVLGVRSLESNWWGEGEVKIFKDGDKDFATIVGTGSEDYVGLSWGLQEAAFPYNGATLNRSGFNSLYRWHIRDPIYWEKDCRITIQQIGYNKGLYERQDDWSVATFWYEAIPSAALPPFPGASARLADVWKDPPK